MVEIFRTNVNSKELADQVIKHLTAKFPHAQFNFDLDDCDRILRAAPLHSRINTKAIATLLESYDLYCEVLD